MRLAADLKMASGPSATYVLPDRDSIDRELAYGRPRTTCASSIGLHRSGSHKPRLPTRRENGHGQPSWTVFQDVCCWSNGAEGWVRAAGGTRVCGTTHAICLGPSHGLASRSR